MKKSTKLVSTMFLLLASFCCLAVENTINIPDSKLAFSYSHSSAPTESQSSGNGKMFLHTASVQEPNSTQVTRISVSLTDMPNGDTNTCRRLSWDVFSMYDNKIDKSTINERSLPTFIQIDFFETGELKGKKIKSEQSVLIGYAEGKCVFARFSRYPYSDNDRAVLDFLTSSFKLTKSL